MEGGNTCQTHCIRVDSFGGVVRVWCVCASLLHNNQVVERHVAHLERHAPAVVPWIHLRGLVDETIILSGAK